MITNQFIIYLCHFHCSHWQNHLLDFTFREKGSLVLVKTVHLPHYFEILLLPPADCNGHVPFDMFHHIRPQNDTLGFFWRKYLSEQHWQMRHIRLHGCRYVYCIVPNVYPLRKHAYSNILKILWPKIENFQIKNSDIFHISAQNIDCGYSLEPPRRGGSNECPQSMFWAEIRQIMYTPVKLSFTT